MKVVVLLLRRLFIACFGRTQRVPPAEFKRQPSRVRVAGPALAAFDSEMYAAEHGHEWGGYEEGKWTWLVPIGHQDPPSPPTVVRAMPMTPVIPAPSRSSRSKPSGRGRDPETVRWVNRNVVPRKK